jgi:uncharacterized small protein (DUF1192 family)
MDETSERRKLRFDGAISAGHILTAIAMAAGLLTWGFRLEHRVNAGDERITRLEAARARDDQQTLELRDVLTRLSQSVTVLTVEVERLRAARERDLETRGRTP